VTASTFDLLGLAVLLLAVGWGAWYGAWSQLLSLSLLLLSLAGARWLAPHLEQPLGQAFAVPPANLVAAAWALAAVALLLALSLLARLLRGLASPSGARSPTSRVLGGLLGAAKGLLLVLLLAYGVLYAADDAQAGRWGGGSRLLPSLARLRPHLTRLLDLPECTDEVAQRVEGWLPAPVAGARGPGLRGG
jgi:uncharacterized membrane protein required for colicin V production